MSNKIFEYIIYLLQMSSMLSVLFVFGKPKYNAIGTYLLLVFQGMVSCYLIQDVYYGQSAVVLMSFLVSIFFVWFLFDGTKIKRLLLGVSFYVLQALIEVITAAIFVFVLKIPVAQLIDPEYKMTVMMGGLLLVILVTLISWFFIPKFNKKTTIKFSNKTLIKFMLYPVSQLLLLLCLMMQFYYSATLNMVAIFLFIAVVISLLTDLYMFNNMIEIEKKNIAEQRVKSLEYMTYIQNNEYNHMMEANENIRKLKHDYNNFLNSSVLLLEQDDVNAQKEGLQLIKQLQNRVSTGYKSFCKHHVVNSVLNDKYSTCNEQDIQFACTVNIPNDINIDSIQLCSIFSNSLDNSIRAVSKLPIEKRMIEIDAKVDNNFLIIKVLNSYKKELLEDRPHLGLSIIKEIATSYDGEMIVTEKEDEFSLMICLNLT